MDIHIIVALFIFGACPALAESDCQPRDYGNGGTVCVCNETYCDYLGPISKVEAPDVLVYTSNLAGLRFHKTIVQFQNASSEEHGHVIDINLTTHKTYQTIYGFGGAFTDSTGINIHSLGEDAQKHLMRSYFSEDGNEYNLCRVPIGSTDFSLEAYTYDDGDPDPELKRFALHRADKEYKIPYIQQAHNLSQGMLKLFGSLWTAPKWVKSNGKYTGGTVRPDKYQVWADYYVKFFDAYREHGIKFWGVTTGNEPSLAKFPLNLIGPTIPSIGWTASTMAKWVAENLGPTLNRTGYENVEIMGLDDQRFYLPWFMDAVFKNEGAKRYIKGTAVHWYTDDVFPASLLSRLHKHHPEKFILATEACSGFYLGRGVRLGSWSRGEDYARDIIEDMRNWAIGWVDWNMALNASGGPTYVNNIVDSPIIVNGSANEFYKQPMFYALGHFSKFIPRNSVRIDTVATSKVMSVAFNRPDKGVTLVILNKYKSNQTITILDKSKGILTLNVTAHSITTLVYW